MRGGWCDQVNNVSYFDTLCSNSGSQVSNKIPSENTIWKIPKTVHISLHIDGNSKGCHIKVTEFLGSTRWLGRKGGRIEDFW